MEQKTEKFIMPSLYIRTKVSDRLSGKVLREQEEPGHSWTRNAWNMQLAAMAALCGDGQATFGAGYASARNTTGAITSTAASAMDNMSNVVPGSYGWVNSSADELFGIVVGTGSTAFDIDDYILASLVEDGTGTGEMLYSSQLAPVQAYALGTNIWTVTHKRNIVNDSGASIVIAEIGLIWRGALFSGTSSTYKLMARDVLGSSVTVADGELLTVEYEISMDFSSVD